MRLLLVFFTLMLGISGVAKAADIGRFEKVVEHLYRGLPSALYPLAAWGMIAFELVAAAAIWFRRTRVWASWAIAAAMWFFVLVQVRIFLFFPGLDCSCFGKYFTRKPGFKTLGENLVFLVLAIGMARLASRKEVPGVE